MQVQLFYAWRIYKLIGNVGVVLMVAIPSVVGGREWHLFGAYQLHPLMTNSVSGIGTAIGVGILPQFSGLQRLKVWFREEI